MIYIITFFVLVPSLIASCVWVFILQIRLEKLKKNTVDKSKFEELQKKYDDIRQINYTYHQKTEYSQTIINPKL